MSLLSRLFRIERRIPSGRRIRRIVETIVEGAKDSKGQLVPVAVIRENIGSDAVVSEVWYAPDIPEPLPESIDIEAMERFKRSPSSEAFSPPDGAGPAV